MRPRPSTCFAVASVAYLCAALTAAPLVGAEDAPPDATAADAPADPTRGGWDPFLDPLRDLEDRVTDAQTWIEEKTKVHVGAGITKSWQYVDNNPSNGIISLHSLDPDHDSEELDFAQFSSVRPSDGWLPGFGVKLDAGRTAKRIKADWDGSGAVEVGDNFEKNSFEIQDLYLTWTVPDDIAPLKGITFKGGKFVTLLGAEVIEPWANYNFSRSFLFGLAIPFTHFGGLVTIPITERLSVTGGAVTGWDVVDDNNEVPSELGNVTWIVNDVVTLSLNGIIGPEQTGNEDNLRAVGDVVATITPTDRLTFVLNYDYGHEENATVSGANAHWQGFAAVANYAWTDRFSTALRAEWFDDADGIRSGEEQALWETTLTARYLFTQHFFGQLEYRHDDSNHDVFLGDGSHPYGNQDIVGFNFTYLWN